MKPKPIQQTGILLDNVLLYAYDSNGEKIVKYKEKSYKIPFKVRQSKALLAIWAVLLAQKNILLDSSLDIEYKTEALKAIRNKYNSLSYYLKVEDIHLINALFKDGV